MAVKASEMTDEEIKEMMRAIAKMNGRPLSDERIDVSDGGRGGAAAPSTDPRRT
jgi:hypothetical protein